MLANSLCRVEKAVMSNEQESITVRCLCRQKLVHCLAYQRLNLFGGNCVRSVFVNRFGISFSVITSKSLMNFMSVSEPSSEDTWFPGYKWEILVCSSCRQHIGWRFTAGSIKELWLGVDNHTPSVFFAIAQSSVYFTQDEGFVLTRKIQQIKNVKTTGEKQIHDKGCEEAPNLPQNDGQSTHHVTIHGRYSSTEEIITDDMKYIRFYS